MRTFETSEKYNVQARSKEEEEEYRKTEQRIGERAEENMKDVTKDLLVYRIYKMLTENKGGVRRRRRSEETASISKVFSFFLLLVTIGSMLYYFYSGSGLSSRFEAGNAEGGKSEAKQEGDEFVFEKGSKFEDVLYIGKDGLIEHVVSQMTKMMHMMKTLSERDLQRSIETTQRNYIFHGPPGTGKTQFVKRISYLLDLNLRLLELRGEVGAEVFDSMDHSMKMQRARAMRSLVRITFITPSNVNDKYVGETEKKLQLMFKAARDEKRNEGALCIIFIDEVDSMCGKRKDSSHDYTIKAQTEFLNQIGGMCDVVRSPLFLFGATNRYEEIDDAFKRRFSNTYRFDLPNEEEVLEILDRYLGDGSREVTSRFGEILNFVKGMSQADIVNVLKRIAFSHDGKMTEIGWEELKQKFEEADPQKRGKDATNIQTSESQKMFYFLRPRPKRKKENAK